MSLCHWQEIDVRLLVFPAKRKLHFLGRSITVTNMAKVLGISRSHLYRHAEMIPGHGGIFRKDLKEVA